MLFRSLLHYKPPVQIIDHVRCAEVYVGIDGGHKSCQKRGKHESQKASGDKVQDQLGISRLRDR